MGAGWRWWLGGAAALCVAASSAFGQTSGVCARLETQLAMQQGGSMQPAPGETAAHDAAIAQLRASLDGMRDRARVAGCSRRGAIMFQPPRMESCNRLDAQMRAMEAYLRRLTAERDRLAPRPPHRGDERTRQMLLAALAENDCGPQYARFAGQRDDMFLRDHSLDPFARSGPGMALPRPGGSSYRTVCVRLCDGYYWPISFQAVQAQFGQDARLCRAACEGSEVALYVHRNPGEGIEQAVSLDGTPYTALPNALRYRREYVEGCGCRARAPVAASAPKDAGPPDVSGESAAMPAPRKPGEVRRVGPEFPVYR